MSSVTEYAKIRREATAGIRMAVYLEIVTDAQ
jgi:hypothetical protein